MMCLLKVRTCQMLAVLFAQAEIPRIQSQADEYGELASNSLDAHIECKLDVPGMYTIGLCTCLVPACLTYA